ncbi:MAG: efflux RND transporter permease subunit [Labilithrix sp.]|nr:efflux RND transporter permease subunit [Labilithrix sp.]MCW5812761.1 efflux RND transporter permease subunit [Labilithrix sp.]
MQWLARISVRRPVFASVLILAIMVLGVVGYSRLGVDQFPNVDIPIVVVTTHLEGASPEEIEIDVTDKIEAAVNTIAGIDELNSTSSEGVSQVIISFKLEKDLETAVNDVRDKINRVTQDLPKGIDAPIVTKVDPGATPVLLVGVRAKDNGGSVREISEVADKTVRRQLETINGVGQVTITGSRERQINILMNPTALRAENITASDVLRTLQSQNLMTPGGSLETGPKSVTLKIEGRVASREAIERLVIKSTDGRILRIGDVAKVVDGMKDVESLARYDGQDIVVLSIVKQSGTNTIEVTDAVLKRLDAIRQTLPPSAELVVVRDNSQSIRTSVHAVTEHLVLGALFASLVVLLFLGNVRSTLIAAVAIPTSVVGTFGLMYVQGYTLNGITLLALALAVGLVIDDAIVVLENIVRFIDERKMKPFPASILATKDIGLAVLATTLSLMAVFVPVAFIGGIPGRFLKSFGYTMAFSVGVSLIVSFTLTPMMSARMLRPHESNVLTRVVDKLYAPIERLYMAALRFSLGRRWVVAAACAVTLGSCVPVAKSLPSSFLPQDDKAKFQVTMRAPEGTSSEETLVIAERAAVDLRQLPGVTHILITVAEDQQATRNYAQIYVDMVDPEKRELSQFDAMNMARDKVVAKLPPGMRVNVAEVPDFSVGSNTQNIQWVMSGTDIGLLQQYADTITKDLKESGLAVDVDTTSLPGRPEVKVRIDRDRAADLGVSVSDVAATLQMLVAGVKASTYPENGEEYDIRIRAESQYRVDASSLNLMNVPSSKYGNVPLGQVVKWSDGTAPSRINRYGRERQITLLANAAPGVGEDKVSAFIQKRFEEQGPPANYHLQPTGRTKSQAETGAGFLLAIGIAFVFMYLILAAQFESWLYPGIILASLPLTVPFAFISLKLFGQSLNLFSMLGLLVLFGVVKKNGILQVDHTNALRAKGVDRLTSLLQGNRERLRPILMTTIAFVAGMLPLILSKGIGSGLNKATASIVIGGQTLSLLLTLLAVPVLHSYVDSVRDWLARRSAGRTKIDRGEDEVDAAIAGVYPLDTSHAAGE